MVQSELGLARVFGLSKPDGSYRPNDYSSCESPEAMGKALLESVGLRDPSTAEINKAIALAEINKAIALNDAFVDGLERLRDEAMELRGE